MNSIHKRMALYGAAALALSGIGTAMVVVESEADAMTLLSTVDVQLRLAYGIPEYDTGGEASSRQDMVDEAMASLDIVERQQPNMAVTAEFRGFAHMIKGEYRDAAACYGAARRCEDCGDEQGDVLAFNQARMLWEAGDAEGALAVFEQNAAALDSRFGHQRKIEQAKILGALGRGDEAVTHLEGVIADAVAEPMTWVQAGVELEKLGDLASAESAFGRALEAAPIANYYLGRLKLRQGAVDSAIECLERAVAAAPADTRRLVREEPEAWQELSEDERFRRLTGPAAATPGR